MNSTLLVCGDFRYPHTNGYNKDLLNTLLIADRNSCFVLFINIPDENELTRFLETYALLSLKYQVIKNKDYYFLPRAFSYIISPYKLRKIIYDNRIKYLYFFPFHLFYLSVLNSIFIFRHKRIYAADLISINRFVKFKKYQSSKFFIDTIFFFLLERILILAKYKFFLASETMKHSFLMPNSSILIMPTVFQEELRPDISSVHLDNYVLFLRPNGLGMDLMLDSFAKLNVLNFHQSLCVVGSETFIRCDEYPNLRIIQINRVDDLSAYIVKSNFVVITDIDGVGFSNRAYLTLILGGKLITTLNGVRGISLNGNEYHLIENPEDIVFFLNGKKLINYGEVLLPYTGEVYNLNYMKEVYQTVFL